MKRFAVLTVALLSSAGLAQAQECTGAAKIIAMGNFTHDHCNFIVDFDEYYAKEKRCRETITNTAFSLLMWGATRDLKGFVKEYGIVEFCKRQRADITGLGRFKGTIGGVDTSYKGD